MIEVKGLRKTYGDKVVVDDISMAAPDGALTYLLGPNGAGKSTMLRMIAGLSRPESGTALIDGQRIQDLRSPIASVGFSLSAAAIDPSLTATRQLGWQAELGGIDRARVPKMLKLVGLADAADKKVGDYSLGMRQRLGIANALLGDPQMLILDEPANGLDPAGIHWMRSLLRDYADRGGTVLLSSHLLHEIEIIADDIVVIGHGQIVAQGTKQELLAGAGTRVVSTNDDALGQALYEAGMQATAVPEGGFTVDAAPVDVGAVALERRVQLIELRPGDGARLEEMFLQLTQRTQRDQRPASDALSLGAQS